MSAPLFDFVTERAAKCAELGHPGACYNAFFDKTWCACGQVIRDGDHFTHVTCCGGPLDPRVRP